MVKSRKMISLILSVVMLVSTFAGFSVTANAASDGTWHKNSVGWWYTVSNGSYYKDKIVEIGGQTYYFNEQGYMITGWRYINNNWYWFDASGAMITGWRYINGDWYWFRNNGAMITGWRYINNNWYWFKDNGAMITGWKEINGSTYYFHKSGAMATDEVIDNSYVDANGILRPEMSSKWVVENGKWRYKYHDGSYAKDGFVKIGDYEFAFDTDGYMLVGFQKVNEKYYYFDNSGYMQYGWFTIDNNQRYFQEDGTMAINKMIGDKYVDKNGVYIANQWVKDEKGLTYRYGNGTHPNEGFNEIEGYTYYFNNEGYVIIGWKEIDDNKYYFNDLGHMIRGWQFIDNNWYHFDSNGLMETGWKKIQNKWYYFEYSGIMATGWKDITRKTYYFDESGAMLTGWQIINEDKYYFYSSGALARNAYIDGHYLGDDGVCQPDEPTGHGPLTEKQKQWVVDNYFGQFPKYGAHDKFEIIKQPDDNGLDMMAPLTQDNYKQRVADLMVGVKREAKNCRRVSYRFYEKDGETILKYRLQYDFS